MLLQEQVIQYTPQEFSAVDRMLAREQYMKQATRASLERGYDAQITGAEVAVDGLAKAAADLPLLRQALAARPPANPRQLLPGIMAAQQEYFAQSEVLERVRSGLLALPSAPAPGVDPDGKELVLVRPSSALVSRMGYGAAFVQGMKQAADAAAELRKAS